MIHIDSSNRRVEILRALAWCADQWEEETATAREVAEYLHPYWGMSAVSIGNHLHSAYEAGLVDRDSSVPAEWSLTETGRWVVGD